MNAPAYPATRTIGRVDSYHGVDVPDPYRWLEDVADPMRPQWIAAQNAVTEQYLDRIAERRELRERFQQLVRYPRYYDFCRRGSHLLYLKNEGLQSQLVLYRQSGLTGSPEALVDPQEWAVDGTIRIAAFALSRDAQYVAYGLSKSGSDWQEVRVRHIETRQDLGDYLRWVKGPPVAWRGQGFYYSRFPVPTSRATALSEVNDHHQVWYHRLGTAQLADELVYEDPDHPRRLHFVHTTEDERFIVLTTVDGAAGYHGNALAVLDTRARGEGFTVLVAAFNAKVSVVDSVGRLLLCLTDHGAPCRRLVLIDPAQPEEHHWCEVIPEQPDLLEQVTAIGGKLFAVYRRHAAHRLLVLSATGSIENKVPLGGCAHARVFPGQCTDGEALYCISTFTSPPTIYQYDISNCVTTPLIRPILQSGSDHYETHQVFYPAKDGTRIPMFLVHGPGLVLDGRRPTLLYGYGGNGTSVGPAFDPLLVALLERGMIFAVACLRGGGEYGESWHRAGRRERKQTVFDDCIAAAEWLQSNGYTTPERCGLAGTSNGGLLVGAVMTQRPDLFAVALPAYGIMDMLRFQRFTVGQSWISEYGSSDDPGMFPLLLAYSPLHNIREGVRYPATMVTTSEHDDRVVPSHSFKFIATLQAKGARPGPYLIRIEAQSGHTAVNLQKELAERADTYAFLLHHLLGTTVPHPDQ